MVRVPPAQRVVAEFDADNPGTRAFHYNMLYHREEGMFQIIRYFDCRATRIALSRTMHSLAISSKRQISPQSNLDAHLG
jgi:hypothetical protein